MLRERRHAEGGFTLIELLIAIVVSGILIGAITSGFITAMGATNGAHERLIETHDAQTLATYFTSDAQSADPQRLSDASGTATGCAGTSPGTNVLRLQWTEQTTSSTITAYSASYRLDPASPGQLFRYFCTATGSSAAPSTADTILAGASATVATVARNLSAAIAALPAAGTTKISLNLTSIQASSETSPYTFAFTASLRTPAPSKFLLTLASPQVAGTQFNVTLRASKDGTTTDATYSGLKVVTFTGPSSSPGGTSPSYPANVNFVSGVGTAALTLFAAETTTLSATDAGGRHLGTAPVTVASAKVPLTFSTCPPDTTASHTTTETIVRGADPYGNADPNIATALSVSLSSTGGGSFSAPAAVTIPSGLTTSGNSTYQNPGGTSTAISMTGHTTTAGYTDATCSFNTTGGSTFVVSATSPQVASTSFGVTITKTTDGTTTDTSFTGAQTISFAGPGLAPDTTAPSYPATVTFTAGVGTATITLHKAEATTLAVSQGAVVGTLPLVVNPGSPAALCIVAATSCTGTTPTVAKSSTFTSAVGLRDLHGNTAVATTAVTVTVNRTGQGSGPTTSGSMIIPVGQSQTPGTFTGTADNGANKTATFTATSSPSYTSATISLLT